VSSQDQVSYDLPELWIIQAVSLLVIWNTVLYSRECSCHAQPGQCPLTPGTMVGGKTYRFCQKHQYRPPQYLLSTGRHFLGVFVYNKSEVEFIHSSNQTEYYRR